MKRVHDSRVRNKRQFQIGGKIRIKRSRIQLTGVNKLRSIQKRPAMIIWRRRNDVYEISYNGKSELKHGNLFGPCFTEE